MKIHKKDRVGLILLFIWVFAAGCTVGGERAAAISPVAGLAQREVVTESVDPVGSETLAINPQELVPATISPTPPPSPTPTETEVTFDLGRELTIEYLRGLEIAGSEITFEEELQQTLYYRQHLVSYISEGNKIYGLLTIPNEEPPESGFKAIVFNHGYIPPAAYQTTERYVAYVDYLARNGFVVFKIDLRGHGRSEGEPGGSYFSPGYTIDAIAALKSLQTMDVVDPQGIGMWGHSMAGNLVLRAMLIEPEVKAGVIWAGAVYSYDDLGKYGIDDNTYQPPPTPEAEGTPDSRRRSQEIFDTYGRPDTGEPFWQAVSLTENIEYLNSPLQLHHAVDDPVVSIGYAFDLAAVLQGNGKVYEFYDYAGGGHNLNSPYFEQAMQRTVAFFRDNL
jgi:dipeptidyl aminopeptidase/acylaminoacyl peptidase